MSKHISVLLDEALKLLDVKENGVYIDGTLGRGGHSKKILEKLKGGRLYCFDLDEQAIKESKENLKDYDNVTYIHDNFKNMNKYVSGVDGILLDLGVSSPQFDEGDRGFSYRFDGPLDMRMNQEGDLTAYKVVNTYSKEELEKVFWNYGEEKFSRSIAAKIIEKRAEAPIKTTFELVDVIKSALPAKVLNKKGHPAKQCFQALRIEVNGELDSLNQFLEVFPDMLNKDGKVAIITFHSLEDRLVKRRFKDLSTVEDDKRIYKLPSEIEEADFELLNRKALIATDEELENNPRSKSAKLRGLRKK
ncbi:MAG: 16S rRNA (cytosine(1402)-N(4))-methyltransferase RsmH [Erysipelotrichaceae bacterium]|nr:16S rRNA (cytosine(1402)-N(4))-methyltransferase RsmH [Erysipelotrichaceae bacterium]